MGRVVCGSRSQNKGEEHMTDLRKAAEMALEALECMKGYGNVFLSRSHEQKPYNQVCAAIEALRQALAKPEQETFKLDRGCWERGCMAYDTRDCDEGVTVYVDIKEKNT
jgi:hypothetical protein